MNRRQQKKKRLKTQVAQLMAENALLIEAVSRHADLIQELYNINSHNVQASNNRFDQLKAETKALRDEIAELKRQLKAKKSWFGRK